MSFRKLFRPPFAVERTSRRSRNVCPFYSPKKICHCRSFRKLLLLFFFFSRMRGSYAAMSSISRDMASFETCFLRTHISRNLFLCIHEADVCVFEKTDVSEKLVFKICKASFKGFFTFLTEILLKHVETLSVKLGKQAQCSLENGIYKFQYKRESASFSQHSEVFFKFVAGLGQLIPGVFFPNNKHIKLINSLSRLSFDKIEALTTFENWTSIDLDAELDIPSCFLFVQANLETILLWSFCLNYERDL